VKYNSFFTTEKGERVHFTLDPPYGFSDMSGLLKEEAPKVYSDLKKSSDYLQKLQIQDPEEIRKMTMYPCDEGRALQHLSKVVGFDLDSWPKINPWTIQELTILVIALLAASFLSPWCLLIPLGLGRFLYCLDFSFMSWVRASLPEGQECAKPLLRVMGRISKHETGMAYNRTFGVSDDLSHVYVKHGTLNFKEDFEFPNVKYMGISQLLWIISKKSVIGDKICNQWGMSVDMYDAEFYALHFRYYLRKWQTNCVKAACQVVMLKYIKQDPETGETTKAQKVKFNTCMNYCLKTLKHPYDINISARYVPLAKHILKEVEAMLETPEFLPKENEPWVYIELKNVMRPAVKYVHNLPSGVESGSKLENGEEVTHYKITSLGKEGSHKMIVKDANPDALPIKFVETDSKLPRSIFEKTAKLHRKFIKNYRIADREYRYCRDKKRVGQKEDPYVVNPFDPEPKKEYRNLFLRKRVDKAKVKRVAELKRKAERGELNIEQRAYCYLRSVLFFIHSVRARYSYTRLLSDQYSIAVNGHYTRDRYHRNLYMKG